MGIDSTSEFPASNRVQLETNDVVFMYTDGIVEAGFAERGPFGTECAVDIVRKHHHRTPDEILAELFESVNEFSRGQLHDDRTAVIIKVDDTRPGLCAKQSH